MEEELVTIIVPIYNSAKYLEETLKSIYYQTYCRLEIILINDGSRDSSLKICEGYAQKDDRCIVINKENTGVSDSRNIGIENSHGKYIFFMDADDLIEKNTIEQLVKISKRENVDMVKCNFYREYKNKTCKNTYPKEIVNRVIDNPEKEILDRILSGKIEAYLWCLLIKKEIIIKNNIMFNTKLAMMEDTVWLVELLSNIKKIFISDICLYHYNMTNQSASRATKYIVRNINNVLFVNELEKDKLKEKNILTKKREQLINVAHAYIIEEFCYELFKDCQRDELEKIIDSSKIKKLFKNIKSCQKKLHVKLAIKYISKNNIKKLCKIYGLRESKTMILKRVKQFLVEIREFIKYKIKKKRKFKFYTDEQVINLVINEKKSISRYGDGEFKWLLGIEQESFQKKDEQLSKRLKDIIKEDNENLIIGIPYALNDLSQYNKEAKFVWEVFINKLYNKIVDYIDIKKVYCNTNITRPYMDYKDKNNAKDRFENIKEIWKNKEVTIVEGEYTKIGVGNDLLNDVKSVRRIICPSTNAFARYNEIYSEIIKEDKTRIILLALGPTATVLASDLSKCGYQAIDIGHVDVEYEWYLKNAKNKQKISGKFVNEVSKEVEEVKKDEKYEKEIVKKVLKNG